MTCPADSPDPAVAHPARVYNAWLGGQDNFACDREVAARVVQSRPQVVAAARENRHFLARVVRYVAQCHGIRQFLDIGCGLPATDNTHKVAQHVDVWSRVVYVDSDRNLLGCSHVCRAGRAAGRAT